MQLVPYVPQYNQQQQNIRAPLTPEQLNKLYNMTNMNNMNIGFHMQHRPIMTQQQQSYQQQKHIEQQIIPPQNFSPTTNFQNQSNSFYHHHHPYNNQMSLSQSTVIATIDKHKINSSVSTSGIQTLASSSTFPSSALSMQTTNPSQSVPNIQSFQRDLTPSPSSAVNKTILTPLVQSNSTSLLLNNNNNTGTNLNANELITATAATTTFRRSTENKKLSGDDLIDLGFGSEEKYVK